jgi:hypothetical protein
VTQARSLATQIAFAIVKMGERATKEEIQQYFQDHFTITTSRRKDFKRLITNSLTKYPTWFSKVTVNGKQSWRVVHKYMLNKD